MKLFFIVLLSVFAFACSSVPTRTYQTVSNNPAVIALVDEAYLHSEQSQYAMAQAKIERALRIEPKNPALWLELAYNHERLGEYSNALNMAKRAKSYATKNDLISRIDALIDRLGTY